MARTRTAAQRRAARITAFRRNAAKAERAGNWTQARYFRDFADRLQRQHERETEREATRRAARR